MKVNKGYIEKNEFSTFFFVVISYRAYTELNCYLRVLQNTVVLNSYLGLFAMCKHFFLLIYNLITYKPEKCLYNVKRPRYEFGVTFVCSGLFLEVRERDCNRRQR